MKFSYCQQKAVNNILESILTKIGVSYVSLLIFYLLYGIILL